MASYEENKKLREQAKIANEERYRESSKKRLIKNLESKFKTTMIGSLAAFEKYFGDKPMEGENYIWN